MTLRNEVSYVSAMKNSFLLFLFQGGHAKPTGFEEDSVPKIQSIIVENADGKVIFKDDVSVGDKLKIFILGEHLKQIEAVKMSSHSSCEVSDIVSFSATSNTHIYFEFEFEKYSQVHHLCIRYKAANKHTKSFIVNGLFQSLTTASEPWYRSKYFKCALIGGRRSYKSSILSCISVGRRLLITGEALNTVFLE
uniref:Uncharacterized protein n=1 Tax=Panagrolaimus superbus TaxID=310955 RepID=A0A914YNG6_9BILA